MIDSQSVMRIRDMTQCGLSMCKSALVEANGDMERAIAILLSKSIAVASPGLTNDERVDSFMDSARRIIKRHESEAEHD